MLRSLHLSDIHLGAGDGYGHDVVLSALVRAFQPGGTLAERRPEILFCTAPAPGPSPSLPPASPRGTAVQSG